MNVEKLLNSKNNFVDSDDAASDNDEADSSVLDEILRRFFFFLDFLSYKMNS